MSTPTIRVHVSTRAAILAGKTKIGAQTLEINDAALAELSPELRLEIALLLEGGDELGTLASDPPITEPTIEAIKPALARRAELRETAEREKRVADARAAEVAAEEARAIKLKDAARVKALRDWIAKNGDDEQKARMNEGYLREDEILEAVMDEVLDLPFQEYNPLRRGDACDCACAGHVLFTETAPQYMDSAQYARLTAVREAVPEGATVEAMEHKARCPECKCVPIARIAARVSVPWHGWLLTRDFSLD